jgi:hypothetical protein
VTARATTDSRTGACSYCGAAKPLTREHAYPAWVYRRLGIEGRPAQRVINNVPKEGDELLAEVIQALCRECNGSWAVPEQKVSKWIGDSMLDWSRPYQLGPHQRLLVAAWAVKTALMLELAQRDARTPSFAPPSHFRWFYEHREAPVPPPGCRVWIFGAGADPQIPMTAGAMVLSSPHDYPPKAYLATFTIGFVGFQVFGPDVLRYREDGEAMVDRAPPLEPQNAPATFLTRIWPDAPVFRWPPTRHIDFDQIPWLTYWPRSAYGLTYPPEPSYRRADGVVGSTTVPPVERR